MIPVIGLVGGIGSGKSAVGRAFASLGCKVIVADLLAHEVMHESDMKPKINEILGEDIYTSSLGAFHTNWEIPIKEYKLMNRVRLRELILEDPSKLDQIQALIHPFVKEYLDEETEYYRKHHERPGSHPVQAVIWDVPLLLETGWQTGCDALVCVVAPDEIRKERVRLNRNWDEKWMDFLEKRQFPIREKQEICEKFPINWFIGNRGTEKDLERIVQKTVLPGILRAYTCCSTH